MDGVPGADGDAGGTRREGDGTRRGETGPPGGLAPTAGSVPGFLEPAVQLLAAGSRWPSTRPNSEGLH